jgi:glucose/arabinose dehydrogenase
VLLGACQPVPTKSHSPTGYRLALEPIAAIPNAVAMAARGGDTSLYIGTQDGQVVAIRGDSIEPVLDLTARVVFSAEQGLLGLTFSPDGERLYVHFSQQPDGATALEEFAFTNGVAVPSSARRLLTYAHPEPDHKGGSVLFGPDGMLYLALGDGGGSSDGYPDYTTHHPGGNAQSLATLLGKILRIDPTDPDGGGPATYTVPADNPFAGGGGEPEIWAYGLRNPFRMSFDRATGDLWVGDVGELAREEIDFVAADDPVHPGGRGANFGWNRREGDIDGPDTSHPTTGMVEPILSMERDPHGCAAVIGGHVYRGSRIPELAGAYLYTDLCDKTIGVVRLDANGDVAEHRRSPIGVMYATSFAEDASGELYVLSIFHGVFRVVEDRRSFR